MDEGAHALRSCLLLIVALMGARLEVAGVLMTDCIYSRPVKQISSEDTTKSSRIASAAPNWHNGCSAAQPACSGCSLKEPWTDCSAR